MDSTSLQILKKQIITLVNASQDEALLQDVVEMLYQDKSAVSELYYRKRLDESIQQANAGMLTPAIEVHQMARQRIVK